MKMNNDREWLIKTAQAEDDALSESYGLLAVSPEIWAEMNKPIDNSVKLKKEILEVIENRQQVMRKLYDQIFEYDDADNDPDTNPAIAYELGRLDGLYDAFNSIKITIDKV